MANKPQPLRVMFLTDSSFEREDRIKNGSLRKRALRAIQQRTQRLVLENSVNPEFVFSILRQPGSKGWILRKKGVL